jgi:hypothetical protein
LNTREIKLLTGAKSRLEGINLLYEQLGQKQWFRAGKAFELAGFDDKKNLVHFTSTWALDGGGVGHTRIGLPLESSLQSNGDLAQACVIL